MSLIGRRPVGTLRAMRSVHIVARMVLQMAGMQRGKGPGPATEEAAPKYLRFVRSLAGVSGALAGIALGASAAMSSGCGGCNGICGGPINQPSSDAHAGADMHAEAHDGPAEAASDKGEGGGPIDAGDANATLNDAPDALASDGLNGGGPLTAPLFPAALVA